MENKNSIEVLHLLISELGIPVTRQGIQEEMLQHPNARTLLAISEVLDSWNVLNAAYQLPVEELPGIPLPFIAYFNRQSFVLVHSIDSVSAIISDESGRKKEVSFDYFSKAYGGTVLIAEKTEGSGELGYNKKRIQEWLESVRLPAVAGFAAFLLLLALLRQPHFLSSLNILLAGMIFIKTAGVCVASLLLIQSIDGDNPVVQKLCGNGKKTNCNAILTSKAAKLNDVVSWSEIGFFYFAGTWLALVLNMNNPPIIFCLVVLNLFCLPYTFYSIYYQFIIAKNWCLLCCTIQILLWFEFAVFFPVLREGFRAPAVTEVTLLATELSIPVLFWVILKPLLLKARQVQPLREQLSQFRHNGKLFNAVLSAQPKYTQPEEEWSIVLGNSNASNIITMVTNPYCPPCASTHKLLHQLLEQRTDLQARIVFTASNTEADIKTPVSRHLMALNAMEDKTLVVNALNDWYEQKQKNYEAWSKTHKASSGASEYNKLEHQRAWCDIADVTATPTLLLNGYRMPNLYSLRDLKYMLQ